MLVKNANVTVWLPNTFVLLFLWPLLSSLGNKTTWSNWFYVLNSFMLKYILCKCDSCPGSALTPPSTTCSIFILAPSLKLSWLISLSAFFQARRLLPHSLISNQSSQPCWSTVNLQALGRCSSTSSAYGCCGFWAAARVPSRVCPPVHPPNIGPAQRHQSIYMPVMF